MKKSSRTMSQNAVDCTIYKVRRCYPIEKLVSVETQTEYSVTSGATETRIFVKMYVDAVKSGLLADMGAERWHTLCAIASYMNAKGECFPTQDQIARGIGTSRTAANKRIKRLLEYRWDSKPVIIANKARSGRGTWENTTYTILPISQLAIFNDVHVKRS